MTHRMTLSDRPFTLIETGQKTIELRLYDEKRQRIRKGDLIVFTHADAPDRTICAEVTALHIFPAFDELYRTLPLEKCGYSMTETASARDMAAYYPPERQIKYAVVGIEISVR